MLPILKPAKKLLAEVVPYYAPKADGTPTSLHVCASCDEATHFDSVESDVLRVYEAITGESLE